MTKFNVKKHIEKLAERLSEESIETGVYFDKDWFVEELTKLRKLVLERNIWMRVEHVSKNRTTRKIVAGYFTKTRNMHFIHIRQPCLLALMGCDAESRIKGSGEDMLYRAIYNLASNVCPDHIGNFPAYQELP